MGRAVLCVYRCQCQQSETKVDLELIPVLSLEGSVTTVALPVSEGSCRPPTLTLSSDRVVLILCLEWHYWPLHMKWCMQYLQEPACWDHLLWPDAPLGTRVSDCYLSHLVSLEIGHVHFYILAEFRIRTSTRSSDSPPQVYPQAHDTLAFNECP